MSEVLKPVELMLDVALQQLALRLEMAATQIKFAACQPTDPGMVLRALDDSVIPLLEVSQTQLEKGIEMVKKTREMCVAIEEGDVNKALEIGCELGLDQLKGTRG